MGAKVRFLWSRIVRASSPRISSILVVRWYLSKPQTSAISSRYVPHQFERGIEERLYFYPLATIRNRTIRVFTIHLPWLITYIHSASCKWPLTPKWASWRSPSKSPACHKQSKYIYLDAVIFLESYFSTGWPVALSALCTWSQMPLLQFMFTRYIICNCASWKTSVIFF